MRSGDVPARGGRCFAVQPGGGGIRSAREHHGDTGIKIVLVELRSHQPNGKDLIEVGGLADDVGEEQFGAPTDECVGQVVERSRAVEPPRIDDVGDRDLDILQTGDGLSAAFEVSTKEPGSERLSLRWVRR